MVAQSDPSKTGTSGEKRPLSDEAVAAFLETVPDWEVVTREGHTQLERAFSFPDFAEALAFTNAVGDLAETLNHHPTIVTAWGSVTVTWWSHDAGGLTKRDLRAAQETDQRYEGGSA
ncbi:MAG: 4a-hydroxytetrahydrobiopterin dehydratase [Anaerolineae bacterium]|nr:4a-hydroxytetrahydrobiopterin dehydratase [Anaerolineae bacterium]